MISGPQVESKTDTKSKSQKHCLNPRLTKGGCCNPPYGFSPVALKR